jgi:hypothetical protein
MGYDDEYLSAVRSLGALIAEGKRHPEVLSEAPPIEVNGTVWSRSCPHCHYVCQSVIGPVITGEHLCHRGDTDYLVRWRT